MTDSSQLPTTQEVRMVSRASFRGTLVALDWTAGGGPGMLLRKGCVDAATPPFCALDIACPRFLRACEGRPESVLAAPPSIQAPEDGLNLVWSRGVSHRAAAALSISCQLIKLQQHTRLYNSIPMNAKIERPGIRISLHISTVSSTKSIVFWPTPI